MSDPLSEAEIAALRERHATCIGPKAWHEDVHRLLATFYRSGRSDAGPCARYWGSDGTLCSSHNGRFASDTTMTCDRKVAALAPATGSPEEAPHAED